MANRSGIFTAGLVVLVVLVLTGTLFVAGCTDNQQPDTSSTPAPAATTKAVSPVVTTPADEKIPQAADQGTTGQDGKTISTGDNGNIPQKYITATCAQIGGTILGAGKTCPGMFINSSDSMRCCMEIAGGSDGTNDKSGVIVTFSPR